MHGPLLLSSSILYSCIITMSSIHASYAFLHRSLKLRLRPSVMSASVTMSLLERNTFQRKSQSTMMRKNCRLQAIPLTSGSRFGIPCFRTTYGCDRRSLMMTPAGSQESYRTTNQGSCGARQLSSRIYASKDGDSSSSISIVSKEVEIISIENLHEAMRRAYFEQGETDGILNLAPFIIGMDDNSNDFTGADIIQAALEATNNNKGQASGIINALIASCCSRSQQLNSAEECELLAAMAWDMYSSWEELAEDLGSFQPDIVTLCCTYSALRASTSKLDEDDVAFYQSCAEKVLNTAQRRTKKSAGSKRRKLLVSISRRHGKGGNSGTDNLKELQSSYGEDFDILHEDDDVIVVNKPAGMVCFHSRKTTDGKIGRKKKDKGGKAKKKKKKKGKKGNAGNEEDDEDNNDAVPHNDISLEDALIDVGVHLSTLNPDALGIVHRIDRGTSGCIVLAKNNDAHARLVTSFFLRQAKKSYNALVPYYSNIDVENKLEETGEITEEVGGRPAQSSYRVDRCFGTSALLLNVGTNTGRKHQVRIHCAKGLGRPIFLDPLYSDMNQDDRNGTQIGYNAEAMEGVADRDGRRFFLHASSLHVDEFGIDVTASLPSWWSTVLDKI